MRPTPRQAALLSEWGVSSLEPVDTHAWVWWARRGHDFVMVKTGDVEARAREGTALRSFGGGSARLLEQDVEAGVIVVERILPGDDIRPLSRSDDDAATREIAQLARRLHVDQPTPTAWLPPLRDIGAAFDLPADPRLPRRVVELARSLFDELIASSPAQVVLHGDLHHMNVLRGSDGWTAIDPHGWLGDPAFDAAPMLANPRGMAEEGGDSRGMDGRELARRVLRRSQVYAEAVDLDPDRVRAWGLVGCVIAELWLLEDHDLIHGAPLAVAEALIEMGAVRSL